MNEAKKIAPRNKVSGERIRKLLCFSHNAQHFNRAFRQCARGKPAISGLIAFG